ncbi:MAG: type II secretion system protein GspL [Candidatus Thiodiazotropha sp. (ex Myrtea sp. 'scaly one' KF741663)]|nr:type II secretion system protein GspL [Candidatus Thiodiazotropha sp. (ex Myrtea sp. 'scaly one' KF741663)]
MAETLIIYSSGLAGQAVTWQIQGGLQALSGEGDLAAAAELARGRRTLLLIPASEVLITKVQLPTKNRQRLMQAIPFALETELTQDVEHVHFAIGATDSDNITPVIVINRSRLDTWLSRLESAGIEPLGIYIDLLCLPLSQQHWSLYHDDATLLVRTGPFEGFSVGPASGVDLIQFALQQSETPPETLDVHQLEGAQSLSGLETVEAETHIIPLENQVQLTELMAGNLKEKQQINLLQGNYQRVDKLTLQWKRWLPAAILAGIALLLTLVMNVTNYYSYKQQSTELDTRIRQVFQQAFPNIKRVVDPKVQMEQQLKAMRSGQRGGAAQFASLFIPAASVIQSSPNTQLESVSFRDGQLDLQLTIKELQALENLKKTIEQKALSVEIRAANASGNQVTSHLRISGDGK